MRSAKHSQAQLLPPAALQGPCAMHSRHPHSAYADVEGQAWYTARGRGRGKGFLAGYGFYFVLLAAALVVYLAGRSLRQHFGQHEQGVCTDRLRELGLDFTAADTSGDTRLAVSQHAISRRHIYEAMVGQHLPAHQQLGGGVRTKALTLGGIITQGLSQADLFHFQGHVGSPDFSISPVLRPLSVPVRAMILPLLDRSAANRIHDAVVSTLLPVLPEGGVWLQDSKLFHSTVFHASSHTMPVPASKSEVEDEAGRINSVTHSTCPINGVLERIIMTSSGVVVACWQVLPTGGEPAELRQSLREVLPNAPPSEGQMVREPAILHTTLARLLQPPEGSPPIDRGAAVAAVDSISQQLCGLTTTFEEVWFIEELDLLALALNGRYVTHRAPLQCPSDSSLGGNGGVGGAG